MEARPGKLLGAVRRARWPFAWKPESISVAVYLISVVFLSLAIWHAVVRAPVVTDGGVTVAALVFLLVLVTFELAVSTPLRSGIVLALHAVTITVVLGVRGFDSPLLCLMLFCTLVLNLQLRFPLLTSAVAVGVVVAIQLAVAVTAGAPVLELTLVLATEVAFAYLWEVFVYYREELVLSRSRLRSAIDTIESLSAANQSFIQQLPEIRETSAEAERLRITRELHDSIGYALTSIVTIMNAAQYIFEENPRSVVDYCLRTKDLAAATMQETRSTLYRLRSLHEAPPDTSIFFMRMCRDFQEATGIRTECHPGNLPAAVPARVFNALLRSVQVGFINALRHSKATAIKLYFWDYGETLQMTVWNSVQAAESRQAVAPEGIGLQGIRERLAELEGELRLGYTADGFRLSVAVPLREAAEGPE